jgi:hypothetical protein
MFRGVFLTYAICFSPSPLANGLSANNGEKCKPQVERLNATAPSYFTHISKCAGTSALKSLANLGIREGSENCYRLNNSDGIINVVLLRSPRDHVLSQYCECAYDGWGRAVTGGRGFPRNTTNPEAAFAKWVDFFADPEWHSSKGDFNCYNPRNFIARSLTCGQPSCRPKSCHNNYTSNMMQHVGPGPGGSKEEVPALKEALRSVQEIELIGLTELYEESMCVFEYRLKGSLGKGCTCEEPLPLTPHDSHGVPPHHINMRKAVEPVDFLEDSARSFPVQSDLIEETSRDMSVEMETLTKRMRQSTLEQIDEITSIDSQVYAATARRFLCDLRAIEGQTGQCLLRQDRLAAFLKTNHYIHGLL